MPNVTTGVVFRPQTPPEQLRELGAAGATSVVFQGSAEAPDPGPLTRAVGRSAEPSAQGHR